ARGRPTTRSTARSPAGGGARGSKGTSRLARGGRAAGFRSAASRRPSHHRLHVAVERHRHGGLLGARLQRDRHDFGDLADEVDRQLLAHLYAEILLHVLFVLPRQDQLPDAVPPRRQHLLLDAADREYATPPP